MKKEREDMRCWIRRQKSLQELILPFFDKILSGFTALRLLELAPKLVERGLLKDIRTGNLTVEEDKGVVEMMYVGSTLPILPIISWDEEPIGDGNVGELTMALSDLLWEDMVSGPESQRLPVPYVQGFAFSLETERWL